MAVNLQKRTDIAARFNGWCRSHNRPFPTERDGQLFFDNAAGTFPAVATWIGNDVKAFIAFLVAEKLVKKERPKS